MPTNWKLLESLHNFEERFHVNKNLNNLHYSNGATALAVPTSAYPPPDTYKINAFQSVNDDEVYYDLPRAFAA
jgi:hypothetical protein